MIENLKMGNGEIQKQIMAQKWENILVLTLSLASDVILH